MGGVYIFEKKDLCETLRSSKHYCRLNVIINLDTVVRPIRNDIRRLATDGQHQWSKSKISKWQLSILEASWSFEINFNQLFSTEYFHSHWVDEWLPKKAIFSTGSITRFLPGRRMISDGRSALRAGVIRSAPGTTQSRRHSSVHRSVQPGQHEYEISESRDRSPLLAI